MSVLVAITFRANLADILYTPTSAKISVDTFLSSLFSASSSNIAEPIKIFKKTYKGKYDSGLLIYRPNNGNRFLKISYCNCSAPPLLK
ncbi:hypothetical protein ALC60_01151 [Trachymyrmex zeteki]|uniref:Uncharacterized protein n=1 Tax=Mycetomoellerius zeteki TaxID=64791 RepID=A0A151XH92_9HYME|nr:hypothetical protein ALC60_01151 [Trachymyrmex zeteki]